MNPDNETDRFPCRRNPRLKHYNYATPNYYFITICAWRKRYLFWQLDHLNAFGKIAARGFEEIPSHFPDVSVDKYVIMPNHVHAILILNEQISNLSTVIGLYKSFVTKQIHRMDSNCKVWQTSFHDHVIRDQKDYERIWLYIEANPARWNEDCFYQE